MAGSQQNNLRGVSKEMRDSGLSSRDDLAISEWPRLQDAEASSGAMHSISLGEANWRIGAGDRAASSEAIACSDADDRYLLGRQSNRNLLYPLLDAIKKRCQAWSSCVGRMRKAWMHDSGSTRPDCLSSNNKSHMAKWDGREELMPLGTGESANHSPSRKLTGCCPTMRLHDHTRMHRFPLRSAVCDKLIFFIRHGTAFCNTGKCCNWKVDQRLTSWGWDQTILLKAHLSKIARPQVADARRHTSYQCCK